MNKFLGNTNFSPRENFLISLLNRIITEYKNILAFTRRTKALKIVEISKLSSIPGETEFKIQIAHTNSILKLSAAKIINDGYDLEDFSDFHAQIIHHAGQGKLIEFLKLTNTYQPAYHIISKKLDTITGEYFFVFETQEQHRFVRSAKEIAIDKNLLNHLEIQDIYDVAYTLGNESILNEKSTLMLLKNNLN